MSDFFKLPRIYTPDQNYSLESTIELSPEQAHYLRNVMRVKEGRQIRVFNAQDGEYLGTVIRLSKKEARIELIRHLKEQPPETGAVHLLFAPIKKHRMDILIEKSVELGVTDFHPLVTQHTEVRKINAARLRAQITEAAEQCERFNIPSLHDAEPLPSLETRLQSWNGPKIMAAIERFDAPYIADIDFGDDKAFLIGPVGGFDEREKELIASYEHVQPISLGDTVFRVETAALYCLAKTHI